MRIEPLLKAALLVCLLIGWSTASIAQTSWVFTIRDLPVDQRAATEVAAKDAAVMEGAQRALALLLRRITQPEDWDRLPTVSAEQTDRLIRNISFSDEKIGGGRYLANVTYRFRPSAIRPLLVAAGIAYAESASRPLVVLPILESSEGTLFWDEGNQWLQAWTDLEVSDGLVPLVMPLGDLSDVAAIGLQQALVGEREAVGRVASKYRAGGALTVVARPTPVQGGLVGLTVSITGYGRGWDGTTFVHTVAPVSGEPVDDLYRRAAQSTAAATESYWKKANLISAGQGEQRLSVVVPLSDLRQWLAVRNRLSKLVIIRRTDIRELTIQSAELDILYTGDLVQLQRGLSQQSLSLIQDPLDGRWRLETTR